MEGLTFASLCAAAVLLSTVCSIASFLLGRKKAAVEDGQHSGSLKTDVQYIKETLKDTAKTMEQLTIKLEAADKQREEDYRQMLVSLTELKSSYKSLHTRVDAMQKLIDSYHHV